MLKEWLPFVKAAVQNPMQVSTIFQTTRWLRDRMLEYVDFAHSTRILELGPGAGAITKGIQTRMQPNANYFGLELNATLIEYLHEAYPGLQFVHGSAEQAADLAKQHGPFDVVISSLPWTVFSEDLQRNILRSVHESLKPDGLFLTYVCINATVYVSAQRFRRLLSETFQSVERSPIEWRNIPPAFVYICKN